jgi:hypothetical protein
MENIVKSIELLKKNKSQYDKNEYYYRLNDLYQKMSNCETNIIDDDLLNKVEYDELLENILKKKTHEEVLNITNFKKIYHINKLFKLLLIENSIIKQDNDKYNIQTEPIININYDQPKIIKEIKTYLHLNEIIDCTHNKCIIVLIIFDTLLKNFKFVLDNEKFKISVKKKLNEMNIIDNKEKFNQIINNYNLDSEVFDKWEKILQN